SVATAWRRSMSGSSRTTSRRRSPPPPNAFEGLPRDWRPLAPSFAPGVELAHHAAHVLDVLEHRPLGGGRLAAPDRTQDAAVLLDDLVALERWTHVGHERRLEHLEDPAREGHH